MWLWTPPSERRPMKWIAESFSLAFFIAARSASFLKKSPSWISLVILVSSWYTIRPAPIFIWPTSELPIWPSGRPTASPLALPFTKGYSAISLSMTGVFASYTAFASCLSFRPYPSRIIKTVGFLLIMFSFYVYSCISATYNIARLFCVVDNTAVAHSKISQ